MTRRDEECITCFFWDELQPTVKPPERTGYCRKYAPREISGVGEGYSDQKWPITKALDWCGEYINRLKEKDKRRHQ